MKSTLKRVNTNGVSEQLEYDIMLRLHMVWQGLRTPTPQDRLYVERCWGLKAANGQLNQVYNNFQENKIRRLNHNRNKKEKKERIQNLDCNIVDIEFIVL